MNARPRRTSDGAAAVDAASAGPLAGFTVAVTADRGRDELAALLQSQDARVVLAPALRDIPLRYAAEPVRAARADAREAGAQAREAGADVIEVPVYRWGPPADPAPLRRLGALIGARLVDAVTFTSVPAVWELLDTGGPAVLDRLRMAVMAACVGPDTAEPLTNHGIPVVAPDRPQLGALVHALVEELPRSAPTLKVAGALVTLRGHAAVVNGALKPLSPGGMAVLRALAEADGEVLSRTALRRVLPPGADEHTVDMAVVRLRVGLGGTAFVEAVVRRGYRLALD
jgi:uroporphyrinogen-III synthase